MRVARVLAVSALALVVLAGVALGLSALLGSSSSPASAVLSGPTGPLTWLGMEVETASPSGVVIATVAPGSQGEIAGLEPGDRLLEVNNRSVNSTGDLVKAISGLGAGHQVPVEVSRGSTLYTTSVILGTAPSHYP